MTGGSMPSRKWIVLGVVLLLLGGGGGYWLATYLGAKHAAGESNASDRKVLYWHDPMVPSVKFDKPGKSPFMDMQLVAVYADEGGNDSGVRVAANVTQSLGVRLGKVEKTTLQRKFSAVGSVAFDEHLLEVVPARVEGYATRLHVRAPLERVRRGQPLAEIQAPEWLEAQQEYLALLDTQSDSGKSLQAAARARLRILGVPEASIARLERERRASAVTTIVSPIDGVVSELGIREGAAFMPGTPLFRINGLTSVWVNARIPEAQVSLVSAGSQIEASATAWPGLMFTGRVLALLPQVEADTRTLIARVALDNADGRLAPGMFVTLQFAAPTSEEQLVIPSEAVIVTGERSVVIVANADGTFGVADITVGADQDGRTAILKGLTEGQSIVVSGQFLIDSEASLKSTGSRIAGSEMQSEPDTMSEEGGAAGAHTTEGTITAIDEKSITLAHEAVPALQWPPMTMGFALPAEGLPDDLKVGDRVSFTFKATDGGFRIEKITKGAASGAESGAMEHLP